MDETHPLERLVLEESFAEIVARLQPEELFLAALRLEGLSDVQIGALLDVEPEAVGRCLRRAAGRIAREQPDLAPLLRGRRQPPLDLPRGALPLGRGWLGLALEAGAVLTSGQAAARCGVTACTVRRWIYGGRLARARQLDDRLRTYRIPEGELVGLG
jgi:DNA-directed RNA polymerase specialized sigma24 family protein